MLYWYFSFNFASFDVALGANRVDITERGSQYLSSRTSFVHSEYNQSTIDNDIAVIRLPQPVDFTRKCSKIIIMVE